MNETKPQHPTYDELIALPLGELSASRADEIREHLIDCPECLAQTRQLLRLPEAPPEHGLAVTGEEQAQAWQKLQARIAAEGLSGAEEKAPPAVHPFKALLGGRAGSSAPRRAQFFGTSTLAAALAAAALGIAVGGLWAPFKSSQKMTTFVSDPLRPESSYRDNNAENKIDLLTCPDAGKPFAMSAAFGSGGTSYEVLVRILDQSGEVVAEDVGRLNSLGILELTIPQRTLGNGKFMLLVQRENRDGPILRYPFEVDCQR